MTELYICHNKIGDNGIACIETALQKNNTLEAITVGDDTVTDEGAVLLLSALTTNCSMEWQCLRLYWSSTHPDSTLIEIGVCQEEHTENTSADHAQITTIR